VLTALLVHMLQQPAAMRSVTALIAQLASTSVQQVVPTWLTALTVQLASTSSLQAAILHRTA